MLNPRFAGEQDWHSKSKETLDLNTQRWLRVGSQEQDRSEGISSEAVSDLNLFLGVTESNSTVLLQVGHRDPYYEERAGEGQEGAGMQIKLTELPRGGKASLS